jgi:putative glutamine amidotransferase
MKFKEDHIILLCALLCLPLMVLLLPAMLIARFGRPKRGVRIALTVSNRWGTYLQYMRLPYDLAILRAGAKVVTIAPGNINKINNLLDKVDGVIISGGEDIVSEDNTNVNSQKTNIVRDKLEREVLKEAERRKMPLLCVCRGMQLLSLHHGGSIAGHDDDAILSKTHKSTLRSLGGHPVEIDKSSRLNRILNRKKITVNSLHHQHITNPGNLTVSGKSPDGLIEAVEMDGEQFMLGVQWHPELLALFDYKEEKLFTALVDAAVKWKNNN